MDILTPEEIATFARVPEEELVDLSVDLDVPVPEEIVRATLLQAVLMSMYDLAKRDGLPFSEYDREDLAKLDNIELRSIAHLCRVRKPANNHDALVKQVVKAGKKVYKQYRKYRPNSQIPMYLPMLLVPLARLAAQGEG